MQIQSDLKLDSLIKSMNLELKFDNNTEEEMNYILIIIIKLATICSPLPVFQSKNDDIISA